MKMPRINELNSIAALLYLSIFFVNVYADYESEDYTEYDSGSCEHNRFYCDYDDPAMFYRCIDGVYYTFRCPETLHFSVSQQTCEWPHLADCGGGSEDYATGDTSENTVDHDYNDYKGYDSTVSHQGASHSHHTLNKASHSHSHNAENSRSHSHFHTVGHSHSHTAGHSQNLGFSNLGEINTWINQPAAGKAWWRPSGVDPSQWQDVSQLKSPAIAPVKSSIKGERKKSVPKASGGNSESSSTQLNRRKSSEIVSDGGDCDPSRCQLPNCYCPGTAIPQGISPSSTPQMVMLTFDDEVSAAFYGYYQRLFRPGRYNPNGCPMRATLFVSGSGTTYDLVYPLYALGAEIASHSVSHRFPHTWWSDASYQEYVEEAVGMKNNLINDAGIPTSDVKGFRVPFLQLGGDSMYGALYDNNFVYDSSMFTGTDYENSDPVWPFTLDHVLKQTYCQHSSCPTKPYPGMWEIPVQRWYGMDGHSCAMPDGCSSTGDAEETLEYLKSNFRRYYNSNRAPLGVFLHARWFNTEHNLDGLDRFIDYLLTLDDVYIVTPSQVIEWMKRPTPLSNIQNFQPWGCEGGA